MASVTIEVGRFLCGDMRKYLDAAIFKGAKIQYMESSGFFKRDFTIKGDNVDVITVHADIGRWIKGLDA